MLADIMRSSILEFLSSSVRNWAGCLKLSSRKVLTRGSSDIWITVRGRRPLFLVKIRITMTKCMGVYQNKIYIRSIER